MPSAISSDAEQDVLDRAVGMVNRFRRSRGRTENDTPSTFFGRLTVGTPFLPGVAGSSDGCVTLSLMRDCSMSLSWKDGRGILPTNQMVVMDATLVLLCAIAILTRAPIILGPDIFCESYRVDPDTEKIDVILPPN